MNPALLAIIMMALMIPISAIVLDSPLGKAMAKAIEARRSKSPADAELADRVRFLEGEVERLSADVERLDEANHFMNDLLEGGAGSKSLKSGD